jgi:histidinol-phosphate aminotransferase
VPHLRKLQLPFEVNLGAQIAAIETLADLSVMRERIAGLMSERERLTEALRSQPYLRVSPSQGNYVLAEISDHSLSLANLRARMEASGVILRYFRTPGLTRHFRVTVGAAQDTEAVRQVLEGIRADLDTTDLHELSAVRAGEHT